MPGLADIATATDTVPVAGVNVTVFGVSARGIAVLLQRFPLVRQVLSGKTADLTAEKIVELIPDAIPVLIAAGTGNPGNAEEEARADKLGVEDQWNLLQKIFALTMPGGVGPFVAKLSAMVDSVPVKFMSIPDGK